ncbi:MAG: peptidoglycan DD-metalloendopeptidase family protein [Caldicoprobacterales bacterium]|jgi:murein DD-endopeptidase MepM/ murein hydrolase activator NlpD|nr:peptidoglycan DD-metalloendopeptidase family protein [Clostridiales bacterium]
MNIFQHPRWKEFRSRMISMKAKSTTEIRHGLKRFKSKFDRFKPRFANLKFFRANISQIGILLMLGVFLTTGMIGNIDAAAPEEVIAAAVGAKKVLINGKEAGYVCDQATAGIVMEEILQDAAENYCMEVTPEHELTFQDVTIAPELLSTKAELEEALRKHSDINVNAYAIVADDEVIGTLRCEEDAQQVLDHVKALYVDDADQFEDVYFQEDVRVVPTPVSFFEVQTVESVEANLQEGRETVEEYTIQKGDTFWSISEAFQIDHDDLTEMNSDIDPKKLQLGQTIRLSYPKSPLNVVTTEVIEYEKSIPYETETQKDKSMYSNESKVLQDGKEGLKLVEARVIKVNGVERERETLSETTLKEPVKKIVVKGTKTPVSRGSGRLRWPVRGRLTSRFGQRWGRLHKGIDLANPKGTPIYAADSGKVIFSGRQGGYGNLVQIDHGDGMVTYYAHMSKRSVSKGDSVSKGQKIGYVGSTGNSTGPHLHFEVRINGNPKNPLKYLP